MAIKDESLFLDPENQPQKNNDINNNINNDNVNRYSHIGFKTRNTSPSFNLADSQLEAISNELKELYKQRSIDNIKLINIDKKEHGLAMSVLCVCGITKENIAVVYPILIEASGNVTSIKLNTIQPQALLDPRNNQMLRLPSDAFDGILGSVISDVITEMLAPKEVRLLDGCVLPQEFEVNNKELLLTFAEQVTEAVYISMLEVNSKISFNLAKEMSQLTPDEVLEYHFNTEESLLNPLRPIRNDFCVELVLKNRGSRQKSLNLMESEKLITSNYGYIDVIPLTETVQGPNGWANNVIRFNPHIIVTKMYGIYNLNWIMLNLSSALVASNNWQYVLKPNKNDPYHDIGYLNILANIEGKETGVGSPINFFEKNVTDYDIQVVMNKLFKPGTIISMDVDSFGFDTWAFSDMIVAAEDNDAKATRDIIEACNDLTNGAFDYKGPVFINSLFLPRGYWTDSNGHNRDLREFDIVWACKELESNIGELNMFINAYLGCRKNDIFSLSKIIEVYQKVLPSAVITGWNHRLTFSSSFISALEQAIMTTGFTAVIDSPVINKYGNLSNNWNNFANAVIPQNVALHTIRNAGQPNQNWNTYHATPGAWYRK